MCVMPRRKLTERFCVRICVCVCGLKSGAGLLSVPSFKNKYFLCGLIKGRNKDSHWRQNYLLMFHLFILKKKSPDILSLNNISKFLILEH